MTNKEWFPQARFGMMLHWGLYSLLGGEYKGKTCGDGDDGKVNELGEWIQSYFAIPRAEYEKLTKAFNPIGFDAEEYVKLAKDAGMNYIVITSKHHEGFAMFKSENDPYNVVDATPYGRDIIGELAAACKKHGMKLGLYYSQELDWHEKDGGGYNRGYKNAYSSWTNNWDFPDNDKKDFSRCLEKKIKPQVREILTQYGDLCLIWFDTPGVISEAQSRELYDMVKAYQPDCLVNSRIGNGLGDYESLGDNQVPGDKQNPDMLYETAATLNRTWGYKSYDQHWKKASDVISLLTRLASRNVNYLLNIGPDPLGRIPAKAQSILREVGEWMKVNGEAVYGSKPSPYNVELSTGPVTEKGDALYFVINERAKELLIPGVLNRVEKAALLGHGDLPFEQNGTTVRVELPEIEEWCYPVVRLSAEGGVKVDTGIIERSDRTYLLAPLTAAVEGDMRIGRASDMENWTTTAESLTWTFTADEAADYAVEMTVNGLYGTQPVERSVVLTVNGVCEEHFLHHDRDVDPLIAVHHRGMISNAGSLSLKKGENTIVLRLKENTDGDMFRFAAMRLIRK